MAWNFRLFKHGHNHEWEDHTGQVWDAHTCELPPEELWEYYDEIQCAICGKVRRFLGDLGWCIIDLFDGNEPSC